MLRVTVRQDFLAKRGTVVVLLPVGWETLRVRVWRRGVGPGLEWHHWRFDRTEIIRVRACRFIFVLSAASAPEQESQE